MVGPPTASFTPRSPYWYSLSLPLPVSFSLSLCIAAKHDWLARESRPTEKEGRGRPGLSEGKREREREREREKGETDMSRRGGTRAFRTSTVNV